MGGGVDGAGLGRGVLALGDLRGRADNVQACMDPHGALASELIGRHSLPSGGLAAALAAAVGQLPPERRGVVAEAISRQLMPVLSGEFQRELAALVPPEQGVFARYHDAPALGGGTSLMRLGLEMDTPGGAVGIGFEAGRGGLSVRTSPPAGECVAALPGVVGVVIGSRPSDRPDGPAFIPSIGAQARLGPVTARLQLEAGGPAVQPLGPWVDRAPNGQIVAAGEVTRTGRMTASGPEVIATRIEPDGRVARERTGMVSDANAADRAAGIGMNRFRR